MFEQAALQDATVVGLVVEGRHEDQRERGRGEGVGEGACGGVLVQHAHGEGRVAVLVQHQHRPPLSVDPGRRVLVKHEDLRLRGSCQ